jgi:hypothetical protein
MKTGDTSFTLKTLLALFLCLSAAVTVNGQSGEPDKLPVVQFNSVPITAGMENLARMADWNFIFEPKLFPKPDGSSKPEPAVTIRWENITPGEALARLAKENGLLLITNKFTTVIRITDAEHIGHPPAAPVLDRGTNGVIPLIQFSDVPLGEALKAIIQQGHLPIELDPQVAEPPAPAQPDFKMVTVPLVSVRWHDLTAPQIIVELCDVYGLNLVPGPAPGTFIIKRGK